MSRVALLRLAHQPPFVAALEILGPRMLELLARPRMARLGALGRVDVAADFHLQMMQRGAEVRLEEEVEHLAALRLGIVEQQPRAGPRAQAADAFEGPARGSPVEGDRFRPPDGDLQEKQEDDRTATG